jgi:predicted nucleotidyltransferase
MLNGFVDDLKRDKARGRLAPHQIIFLLALINIYIEKKSVIFNIVDLINEFQKVWKEHQDKFQSKNNKIGLPLKAFVNRGFVEIDLTDTISDFRKNQELETKITNVKIDEVLLKLFKIEKVKEYLVKRIVI